MNDLRRRLPLWAMFALSLILVYRMMAAPEYLVAIRRAFGAPPVEPALVVATAAHDFGNVSAGASLTAKFNVRNVGGTRLILRKVGQGCPCASGSTREVIVEPGMSRDLSAVIETKTLSGSVKIDVQYETNDPAIPLAVFSLLAEVRGLKSLSGP